MNKFAVGDSVIVTKKGSNNFGRTGKVDHVHLHNGRVTVNLGNTGFRSYMPDEVTLTSNKKYTPTKAVTFFKVGDAVKVNKVDSNHYGMTGTVKEILTGQFPYLVEFFSVGGSQVRRYAESALQLVSPSITHTTRADLAQLLSLVDDIQFALDNLKRELSKVK